METLDLHLSEEDLEAYALGRADDYMTAVVEDHLLLCSVCREALDRQEEEICIMRLALR